MTVRFLQRTLLTAMLLLPMAHADEPSVHRDGPLTLDNFDGLYFGQFGNMGNPPDISGGVGKTGILQVVNTHAAYFPKTGTESREPLWAIPLSGASSAFPSSVSTFRPRAWYDAQGDRFVMLILETKNTAPKKSMLHLAVSKTGAPRGMPDPVTPGKRLFDPSEWHRYRLDLTKTTGSFSTGSPGGADDPTLSGNSVSILVSVNYRDIANTGGAGRFDGGIEESAVLIFDKAPLYAGTGAAVDGSAPPAGIPITCFPASTDGSLQPAVAWQNPATNFFTGTGQFMSLDQDAVDTFIDTYRVNYLGDTAEYQAAHDDVIIPGPMQQPGGAPPLDAHGDRMTSAAQYGPGSNMFGAFVGEYANGPDGAMPTIRLAQVNYHGPNGQIQLIPNDDRFTNGVLPTLAASPGRLCLAFTRSSGTEKPSIVVKMYDFINGDITAPVTSTLLTSATPYHGTGPAGVDFASWGDYAHASVDPLDRTFWICMPYARGSGENQWGTRWFNLTGIPGGLSEITQQINLTTPSNPTPEFGTLLPQGEVGAPVRTIKVAQGQQVFLNVGLEERSPGVPYFGNISWYRDGVLLQSNGIPHLVINPVDLTHQGRYHITASNDIGELTFSEEIYLDVVIPPVASMNTSTLRVHPGLSSYLEVLPDPTAFPEMDQLTYTWNRTFRTPLLGGKVQPFTNASTAADAVAIDGLWTCTVSNLAGYIQISADVMAGPRAPYSPLGPPDPQVGTAPLELELDVNGSSGAGTAAQTRPDFPGLETQQWHQGIAAGVTSVVWRRDGVPITLGGRFTTTSLSNGSDWRLHIANPDYEDEGLYDCIVTDAWGAGRSKTTPSRLFILSPLAPPYLTVEQGQGPEPRTNSGMVYDSKRKKTVLFGGEAFGINPRSTFTTPTHFTSNDTWEWDGKVWVKRNPVHRPPPTAQFGIAYDSTRGRTVIFGGYKDTPPNYTPGYEVITNDVWEWDGNDWTQVTPPTSPPARINPSMCYDSTRGEILMISGNAFNPEASDTPGYYTLRKSLWAWNGTQWTQRAPLPNGSNSPSISGFNAFGFDPGRGVAVLFPEFDERDYPMWEWNGTVWTRILPPLALRVRDSRFSGSAFYDPVRRRVGLPIMSNNLFPGYNNVPTMVWWNGTEFIKGENTAIDDINGTTLTYTEALPFGQIRDLGVFDTHRRCFVWHDTPQFTNVGPSSTREQHFSAKAKSVHQPVEVQFFPGQTVKIRAIHAGLRPIAYQWFRNDVLIPDNTHYSGSTTPTLTITGATAADAGNYTLRAINSMNQIVGDPIRLTFKSDGLGLVVQGDALLLSWPGTTGILETSTTLQGAWAPVSGAISPLPVSRDEPKRFWRVRYP